MFREIGSSTFSLSVPLHSDVLDSECSQEATVSKKKISSKNFHEYYSGTFVTESFRKNISTMKKVYI